MSSTTSATSPGLHHVTAIAGDPRRNVEFHTGLLGLRLVKKTVNFDDPGTWHLYYGDERRQSRHDSHLLPVAQRRAGPPRSQGEIAGDRRFSCRRAL